MPAVAEAAAAAAAAAAVAARTSSIPAIDGAQLADFAQKLGDDGLVPEQVRQFDASKPGTLFATEPPGGTKAKAGDKVKLLVSAGSPKVAFDDEKNIQLVNGATGKPFQADRQGPAREKDPTWSADAHPRRVRGRRAGVPQGRDEAGRHGAGR